MYFLIDQIFMHLGNNNLSLEKEGIGNSANCPRICTTANDC